MLSRDSQAAPRRSAPRRPGLLALALAGACTPRPDPPAIEARPAPAPAPAPREPFTPVPEARELTISRTQCYGPCPDYTAIVGADGSVWYFGRAFAPRIGLHTGRVAPRAVHAVFRRALDSGYFEVDDEYSEPVTDHATVFTSVALGRRAWVRDYARAAPPAVLELEDTIDALVAGTEWDATPAVEPAPAHACADLGRALAQRCRAYLELRGPRADCPYFFHLLGALWEQEHTEGERSAQCAAYLRSLAQTPTPPADDARLQLGPHCTRWAAGVPQACLAALRGGDPHAPACDRIDRAIASFRRFARPIDGDAAAGLRAAEDWCEFRLSR